MVGVADLGIAPYYVPMVPMVLPIELVATPARLFVAYQGPDNWTHHYGPEKVLWYSFGMPRQGRRAGKDGRDFHHARHCARQK